MLLQERIEELGSGILTISNSKVELIGFTCPERLYDFYNKNIKCFYSFGIYDYEHLDFSLTQDNSLFIIQDNDNNVLQKYYFELLIKDKVKFKEKVNGKTKHLSRVYHIRKCKYTDKYNYKDLETSINFDTKEDLMNYFKDRFKKELEF